MADVELVIKIDEEVKMAIDNHYTPVENDIKIYDAIRNGTPLPKGHGRLIDADELLKVTVKRNGIWNAITNSSGEGLEEIINNQPTIESPRWIPVSERLPENDEDVLVCYPQGGDGSCVLPH